MVFKCRPRYADRINEIGGEEGAGQRENERETEGGTEETTAAVTAIHETGKDARRTYKGIDARVADEGGPEFEVKDHSVPAAVI